MRHQKNSPSISIILPTRNRIISLVETIRSIKQISYPKNKIELIVIDNGSTDNTYQKLMNIKKNKSFRLIVIKNRFNKGFAPALNQGIKQSNAKFVFITNDDCLFDKNILAELTKCADLTSKVGIVGGKMLFRNSNQMSLPGFRVNLWLGYHPYDFNDSNKVREMDVATGGCMLIKRSAIDKVGLFDEGFFFCGEDYDYCFRFKYCGFKILYCPTAICYHEFISSRAKKQNGNQLFAHFRGKFRFLMIHASVSQVLFFFPIQLFVAPIVSYIQTSQITILAILRAIVWNILNIEKTFKARLRIQKIKQKNKFTLT